jgi:hypothetical protein
MLIRPSPHKYIVIPEFKITFFRPLSSATRHLDFQAWGSPVLAHLHSALWFVILLLLEPRIAKWAMLFFALGRAAQKR